ncbi:MAG: efflux RND transporter permease subunit [Myxococcota bacterium]
MTRDAEPPEGVWESLLGTLLTHRLVVLVLVGLLALVGLHVAPFDLDLGAFPRDPVPVDALPDLGENQQIVFTEWAGHSPRDLEDQVTYPLTTALMGIPGVRTVRSASAFGFSTIYVVFRDDVEFYWSRSRVLEKLASLPPGTVPAGVTPTLGPDATALGQIFWYTLEGQDPEGRTVGGWDPDELRSLQDWSIRFALQSAEGVSEVASVGGFVREVQVDVDPDALRAKGVTLAEVADAVRASNMDVGARTLELNGVEYIVRGRGFVESLEDLEGTAIASRDGTPVRIRDVGHVSYGPALRRGALDDEGAPAVGGVVVARYGANPQAVIAAVKAKIAEIQRGLPTRTLADGTTSQVTIVPFYDRTTLIDETLGTLRRALTQQMLITLLVVLVMLRRLRSSLLLALMLPLGVLAAFGAMKVTGVGAKVMALGGIAIAIGTMVDVGIVLVENIDQHLRRAAPDVPRLVVVRRAAAEVAPAVMTSVLTTVVSFLPVFGLSSAELRLFAPLAFTKTFAMIGALLLALAVLPAAALLTLRRRPVATEPGALDAAAGPPWRVGATRVALVAAAVVVTVLLARDWLPLGPGPGLLLNLLFVAALLAGVLFTFRFFERAYPRLLAAVLRRKAAFSVLPAALMLFGATAWLGFPAAFGFLPASVLQSGPGVALARAFPGFGREYMPPFDEGSFLYMPSTMPHASIGEVRRLLSELDAAVAQIPEVDRVVGKLGRVESALDPAPVSMIETLVTYRPEYRVDEDGTRVRQWRDHIRTPRDIWTEIARAGSRPGLTGAPMLMPIETRRVMLQSGMRAPMGLKVRGPSLEVIEAFGLDLEAALKTVPELRASTVFADRVVGKPYLEVHIDREAVGRYGVSVADVQRVLQVALGGMELTRTVEGRERYPVRVRYLREERDSLEALDRVLVPVPGGEPLPLRQLAEVRYVRGPQVIRGEDTFLTSYVLFDRQPGVAEVAAVEAAKAQLEGLIEAGELVVPEGVSFAFAGSYEGQLRSERRLQVLVPVAVALVFVLLMLQFRRVATSLIVFSGVAVAASGGFALLWLYGQPWFLDVEVAGTSLRTLFQVGPVHLSVAVWIGFIALIGLATDDGVVMSAYLRQRFQQVPPRTVGEVRERTLEAGQRRIRPCLMTTATTLLALLPVVTSTGRGSDVMVPLALPMLGGMGVALLTLFVVPVLTCALEERRVDGEGRAPPA